MRESKPVSFDDPARIVGRWAVRFADSPDLAVAIFEKLGGTGGADRNSDQKMGGTNWVQGTFLTTTGDYRYLSGGVDDGQLKLSCFDGAHAFLFHAEIDESGKLQGDFCSGNWYRTTWEAILDDNAKLPDAFRQTRWTGKLTLDELEFIDLTGRKVSLGDPQLAGTCRIIELFGSWCPNCHDAGAYLSQLHEKYESKGLKIVGLAFEITGDFEQDVEQVRKFMSRNHTSYPILIAGTSDKELARKAMPVLDSVKSYPTFIFLNGRGNVLAIYTGFSGPATGEAYQQLQNQFEAIIRKGLELE
jgi:thiol-disulfide isomerase/thioredoxin